MNAQNKTDEHVTNIALEARILMEKNSALAILLAIEGQILMKLETTDLRDGAEIGRTKARIRILEPLKSEAEASTDKALDDLLLAEPEHCITPNELEARVIQEKTTPFTVQLMAEEQILAQLEIASPRDEAEIGRTTARIEILNFMKTEASETADKLLSGLEKGSKDNTKRFVTLNELEVRILQEKAWAYTVQCMAEEQILVALKNSDPIDEVEIKRTEIRIGNLRILNDMASETADKILAEMK
jgi:hypothetical protein